MSQLGWKISSFQRKRLNVSSFFGVRRLSKSKLPFYVRWPKVETTVSCKWLKIHGVPECSWKLVMETWNRNILVGERGVTLSAFCFGSPPKFRKQPKFKWLPRLYGSRLYSPTYGRATMEKNDRRRCFEHRTKRRGHLLRAWLPSPGIRFDSHANDATERTKKKKKKKKKKDQEKRKLAKFFRSLLARIACRMLPHIPVKSAVILSTVLLRMKTSFQWRHADKNI